MGEVINKQGMFVVRMAKNLEQLDTEKRTAALQAMHPKIRALVNHALHIFAKKRAGAE